MRFGTACLTSTTTPTDRFLVPLSAIKGREGTRRATRFRVVAAYNFTELAVVTARLTFRRYRGQPWLRGPATRTASASNTTSEASAGWASCRSGRRRAWGVHGVRERVSGRGNHRVAGSHR